MRTELDVLQHLAMEGIAETGALVSATGHPEEAVRDTLATLEAEGCVEDEEFWYLTDDGEERLAAVCRSRFDEDQLADLRALLPEFEALDARMKALAETWQAIEADERGPEVEPVADLAELQGDLEALFADVGAEIRAVYEPYLDRLAAAVERLREGETAYFTATDVDSYHTVWFELHDDLLRTLGEERTH